MHSGRFKVLLDACVLYPAPIRDLLLSFAGVKLYQPLWSDEIQEEWTRNLLKNRPDLKKEQLEWTVSQMNRAFPSANVTQYQTHIASIHLPDEDDRHVVAAAIKGKADVIVTFNLKDFPESTLSPIGIEVLTPDQFALNVIDLNEGVAVQSFNQMVSRLKKPPLSHEDVFSALEKANMKESVRRLKEILSK